MDEDSLMEDAVLYLQKKTYRVGGKQKWKKDHKKKGGEVCIRGWRAVVHEEGQNQGN